MSRGRRHAAGARSLQAIDDGALSNVGVADHAYSDRALNSLVFGVVLNQLEELVRSDAFAGRGELFCQLLPLSQSLLVDGGLREVVLLVLGVGLEEDSGEFAAQVGEPGFGVARGNEIYFVEDEDDFLFSWHAEDLPFKILAPASKWVASIEHLKYDIGSLD